MKNRYWVLSGFIIVKFVLQYLLISPEYNLQRDEYLHLDQANHLAWGYISVPPVTSWISYLIKLLGNDVFWVKFFPALFGSLTLLVVWKTIEALNGKLFALVLGSLAVLVSVLLRLNILYQPNSFDVFFWTLTYFTIVKYISTANAKWIYATALSMSFGILSKYNIAFLLIGLLPTIALTEQRRLFLNKHFYIGIGVALLIVLPNLVWQYRNDFPTSRQLQELTNTQLVNVSRFNLLKEQLLYFLNSTFIIIAAFASFFLYPPFKKYRLFFWSYIITFSLYIFFRAKSYYAIGLYPIFIAFGAVYLEALFNTRRRFYLKPVSIAAVLFLAIPLLVLAFPIRSPREIQEHNGLYKALGLLRWEDGKDHSLPQDFADMIGWSELARKVDSTYNMVNDKAHTIVLCDNYGQAGAINYYSRFKDIHAVSFNADYIDWMPLDKPIRNAILVKFHIDPDSLRTKEKPLFDTVILAGRLENPYAREYGARIFLLLGAKIDVNQRIRNEIAEHK